MPNLVKVILGAVKKKLQQSLQDQHGHKLPVRLKNVERRSQNLTGSKGRKRIKKESKFILKHEGKEKGAETIKNKLRRVVKDPKKSKVNALEEQLAVLGIGDARKVFYEKLNKGEIERTFTRPRFRFTK